MCELIERREDGVIVTECNYCGKDVVLELTDDELVQYNSFLAKEDTWSSCKECYDEFGQDNENIQVSDSYITMEEEAHDTELIDLTKSNTTRGFKLVEFKDRNGVSCSIQESSSDVPSLWIGVNDANPRVMKSEAFQHGINLTEDELKEGGWVEFPIPDNVLFDDRMHLTKEQVKKLIPILQEFIGE